MSKSDVCDGIEQSEFEGNSVQSASEKKCIQCGEVKGLYDYYSKGSRRDSICKLCVLEKKRRIRKKKRQTKERRKATKVLDVSGISIEELFLEKPTVTRDHFESLLNGYMINIVVSLAKEME